MSNRFNIALFNQYVYWMKLLHDNYILNHTTIARFLTDHWDEIDAQFQIMRDHEVKEFHSAEKYFISHFGETFDRIPF